MPNEITPEATIIELNRCKVNGFMPVDVDRCGGSERLCNILKGEWKS